MAPSPVPGGHSLFGLRDIICVVIISDWFISLFFFELSSYVSSLSTDLGKLNMNFYFSASKILCTYLSATDNKL